MLEVCVDSLKSSVNAIRGGADELEICSSLTEGGLTPSAGLVREVLNKVKHLTKPPKINIMIRCRTGSDFMYSELEMDTMLADIDIFKGMGVDRFVFGALTPTQQVDEETCSRIITRAHPVPVTFHRAFDMSEDPMAAMKIIIQLGFTRVLTSGQRVSAVESDAVELIKKLLQVYSDKIEIMPGAGINLNNAKSFIDFGCKIVHSSCKTIEYLPKCNKTLTMGTSDSEHIFVTDEHIVKQMKSIINS